MILKSKPKKVLTLGSGALQIGQAGEFDYSGSQAIKAMKEDGVETALVNPNIATIQTSEDFADKVYFLPLRADFVERVIEKERPDGILLGFGGQTGLNVGLELHKNGTLEKYGVRVLGTPIEAIEKTEDRQLFADAVRAAGLKTPVSKTVSTADEAIAVAEEMGFPVMTRVAYALGGLGSGVVHSKEELIEKATRAFKFAPQILIEESLEGWKELEYEVVRDRFDNCITVCSMENIDPMGVHTGDSVVVAPLQTLTAKEHFHLRGVSIKMIRALGIIGECNIQFALDPESGDYRIIEVNARLSRSSALASKATGYPLAFVAAKLSLGYALNDVVNEITRQTSSNFEPALDYIVLKYPRWDLQKFRQVSNRLGSEMKSVGEVMAIGRKFEEVLQKAIRMLDGGMGGFEGEGLETDDLDRELAEPTDKRLYFVAKALEEGYTVERIHELAKITPWFLHKMKNVVDTKKTLVGRGLREVTDEELRRAKEFGFSDEQLARYLGVDQFVVRERRKGAGIVPRVKQIDTLAAEYPAKTNYLYMTYNGREDDVELGEENQIAVLGGGPYRIGSSVEFDWCCVNAVQTINRLGYKTIMINYNPETVSTDHDFVDKLYFEEMTLERTLDINDKENLHGVIVSMGGQIPNSLAMKLHKQGVRILGTSPTMIDSAENRHTFSGILDTIGVDQPAWRELTTLAEAKAFAEEVGYPVLIRPSYVLSGAAMSIVLTEEELEGYLNRASTISREYPVVISKFITDAREIDVDAVADDGELFCYAISGHVENAGVHSGDATIVLPPQRTYLETMRRVKNITRRIAKALEITGPFNIQFIAKDNDVKVIECNLRASRSFPFVSKVLKINFIDLATRLMVGGKKPDKISGSSFDLDYVGVKVSQFSFTRLKGSDPALGVEMASTGEVACLGDDFNEAFLKAYFSTGFRAPEKAALLSTGTLPEKAELIDELRIFLDMGLKLYGTKGTADFYASYDIPVETLRRPSTKKEPSALQYLADGKIDLCVNIPKTTEKEELNDDYLIRRRAVDLNVPLITNVKVAKRFVKALKQYNESGLQVKSWDEY
jgi:carbamoyl-phosphate synthase large subunit